MPCFPTRHCPLQQLPCSIKWRPPPKLAHLRNTAVPARVSPLGSSVAKRWRREAEGSTGGLQGQGETRRRRGLQAWQKDRLKGTVRPGHGLRGRAGNYAGGATAGRRGPQARHASSPLPQIWPAPENVVQQCHVAAKRSAHQAVDSPVQRAALQAGFGAAAPGQRAQQAPADADLGGPSAAAAPCAGVVWSRMQ